MRSVIALGVVALMVAACGDDTGGAGGSGAGGAGGGTGGSDATTTNTASSTTGTGGDDTSSTTAGQGGGGGEPGTGGAGGTGGGGEGGSDLGADCEAPAEAASAGSCVDVEGGGFECNPITNEGCADGDACDFADGAFYCFPPGDVEAEICGECNFETNFCQGTMTCTSYIWPDAVANGCARYCCDDSDCGEGGTCNFVVDSPFALVGLCLTGDAPTPQ